MFYTGLLREASSLLSQRTKSQISFFRGCELFAKNRFDSDKSIKSLRLVSMCEYVCVCACLD
jgi:hypothetical protein